MILLLLACTGTNPVTPTATPVDTDVDTDLDTDVDTDLPGDTGDTDPLPVLGLEVQFPRSGRYAGDVIDVFGRSTAGFGGVVSVTVGSEVRSSNVSGADWRINQVDIGTARPVVLEVVLTDANGATTPAVQIVLDDGAYRGSGDALTRVGGLALHPDGSVVAVVDSDIAQGGPFAENRLVRIDPQTGDRTEISGTTRGLGPPLPYCGSVSWDPIAERWVLVAGYQIWTVDDASGDRTRTYDYTPADEWDGTVWNTVNDGWYHDGRLLITGRIPGFNTPVDATWTAGVTGQVTMVASIFGAASAVDWSTDRALVLHDYGIEELDLASGAQQRRSLLGVDGPRSSMVWDAANTVWIRDRSEGLRRLDLVSDTEVLLPYADPITGREMVLGEGVIWMTDNRTLGLLVLDPTTARSVTVSR